jgi:hypothetical protein
MKKQILSTLKRTAAVALLLTPTALFAQDTVKTRVANLRAYDKSGINVFEAPKDTNTVFNGLKLKVGAGFTQTFQGLKHENTTTNVNNKLYGLTSGFNTANANLYIDAQLADGIRLNLTTYLSARHHNETWVKGGYIQFDKLPFKGQFWEELMKIATIKVGHMEINYGDAHFRRSDGGHTLYNPFVENYILDGFTTEIGGEVYLRKNALFGMIGVSNGMIKGNIDELVATAADDNTKKSPALYLKGGYDKQLNEKVRVRVAASFYTNNSSGGQTLYAGDRTGSNYFMAMEKAIATPATATAAAVKSSYSAQFTSGRFNPAFSKKVNAFQLNGFVKAAGLEVFGTFEKANGRTANETAMRDVDQYAIDGVYRFGKDENLFVGARYNTVKAELAGVAEPVKIDRVALGAGWFVTKNVLLKGEYVTQNYNDFVATDYRHEGKFNGYVIQAIVGF